MFSPIHQFRNCGKLEGIIADFRRRGIVSEAVLQGYKIYHFALLHKLKCAKYHVDKLEAILRLKPSDVFPTSDEFMFLVNLSLDGYFHSCGSALDILAREILIYFGQPIPTGGNIYFQTAREILNKSRPGDPILPRLQDPPWRSQFTNYRNASTHEIIIASFYTIDVQLDGGVEETTIILPLPDDPRVDPVQRKYNKNPDVQKYCIDNLRRIISLINQIYDEIIGRSTTNNALPI